MKANKLQALILVLVTGVLISATLAQQAPSTDFPSERFEPAIRRFEASIEPASAPAPGTAIVFLGSSTFTRWTTLQADFPGLPVVNRGFGGSEYKDLVFYCERILAPLKPGVVVIYCGGNDIARGTPPEKVAEQARELVNRISSMDPQPRCLVLGSKIAPARLKLADQLTLLNSLLSKDCKERPNADYVDLAPVFLDENGRPDAQWFDTDRLHLNANGYSRLRETLAPRLQPSPSAPDQAQQAP